MKRKALKTMLATVLCLGALATSALAQFDIRVRIGVPPPPERYEVIEEERPGYFWIPGFWYWEGHRHVWYDGRWERHRPGYHWVGPRWHDRGGYHDFEPGRWERGYDGPGKKRGHYKDRGRGHDEGRGRGHDKD